jgi:NitT/TauT family transport system permease protein
MTLARLNPVLVHADRLIGLVPIAGLILAWHLTAISGAVAPALLPPPLAVFGRFIQNLGDPGFLLNVGTTLFRLFVGFSIALVIGVSLGLFAATNRAADAVLRPLVRVLAPVPKIALYPALILTLGFDHASKIVLVVLDATFPILLATYQGAASVEPKLVWSARAAGPARAARS